MPSAPVLVPELAGTAAEAAELRAAALAAARALPARWVVLGAGPDAVYGPDSAGGFAGFGADIAVRLSPGAQQPLDLPLSALVAGWVRGQVCPDAEAVVHCCADPDAALATGRRVRAEIDQAVELTGVLLVADDALAGGDVAALTGLPSQVVGRAGFAALAGLVGTAPRGVTQLYRDAPYGVGYFVGVWQP